MNLNQVKEIARERGVRFGKLNKTDLIRTLQRQEGNTDCYNTGQASCCGQDHCLWQEDCR